MQNVATVSMREDFDDLIFVILTIGGIHVTP